MSGGDVVLYLAREPRVTASRITRFISELHASCPGIPFQILSYNSESEEVKERLQFGEAAVLHYVYNRNSPRRLGYPNKVGKKFAFKPGNADVVLLLYWRENASYERYWVIEDDVEYTGNFGTLIASLRTMPADLLATHVRDLPEGWDYLHRFVIGEDLGPSPATRRVCFLPFYAISNTSLQVLDDAYRRGWAGHHEMTWPAILDRRGLSIMDIGGNGPYVAAERRQRHYIDLSPTDFEKRGSFGVRARLRPGLEMNILWHPVKTFPDWLVMKLKRYQSILEWGIRECRSRLQRITYIFMDQSTVLHIRRGHIPER